MEGKGEETEKGGGGRKVKGEKYEKERGVG